MEVEGDNIIILQYCGNCTVLCFVLFVKNCLLVLHSVGVVLQITVMQLWCKAHDFLYMACEESCVTRYRHEHLCIYIYTHTLCG